MTIRRIAAITALAALLLVPTSGHAIGDAARQVSGSSCSIGNETLVFNGDVGQWEARSSVTCPPKPDGSPNNQGQIDLVFTVLMVQGVKSFPEPALDGPVSFSSQDPTTGSSVYSCIVCPSVQAFGAKISLSPGLYSMKSSTTITQNTQAGTVYRRGTHTTCFLVRNDIEPATAIPGCSL